MAINYSPSIIRDGLVFHYDMVNPQSYKGPPLTNLIPNGNVAGYPSTSSGWGTYNTNQYGSGTYFSIGTISGVASNIITCPNHTLRTYDVVRPQTTAGGVTAGTDYLVRKWDANTFSLYSYDGTQDAVNIFDKQTNFNTDTRIAVSSGITNMWWGYPHLPNSGIMKQIIPNGFRYKGRVHDCIRIHWYRPDGVTDGMAYGNEPTLTSGQTYTVTFWHRAATPNAVGRTAYLERWTNGNDTTQSFTLSKEWQKFSYTFTTSQSGTTYFYWFNNNLPAQSAFDVSEIMCFQGTGQGQEYVSSGASRANTAALLDLTKNYTITANSLTYTNDDSFSFNGSTDYCQIPYTQLAPNNFTVEAWIYNTAHSSDTNIGRQIVLAYSGYNGWIFSLNGTGSYLQLRHHNFSSSSTAYNLAYGTGLSLNTWYHVAATDDGSTVKLYVNGANVTSTASATATTNGTITTTIGAWPGASSATYFTGKIPIVRIYKRSLSPTEILQNFNAQRGRYGL